MTMLKRVSILLVILTLLTAGADAYYDPYIGRFTQRDPIGDGGNWYAYTANNPLKFVDPTGLELVFNESGVSIKDASAINNFYVGDLTPGDQTLFYGLFGTTSGDAGDSISLLDLRATGGMLTDLINHDEIFTLGWKDLSGDVYGEYDPAHEYNKLRINSSRYATDLTALLNESDSHKNFKSVRLTLAHELQHVADDFFGLSSTVPNAPTHIRQDLKEPWRHEYSAYRRELSAAHQLGQLSAGYYSSSFDVLAARRGPTRSKSIQAIRRAATGNVLSR